MNTIGDMLFSGKQIIGEVGIEIEMEGSNFPLDDLNSWYSREDGSLRGDDEEASREFVLIRPCKREDTLSRLSSLASDLEEIGSEIKPSVRTGVHVHTNVRELTYNQLFTYIFSYYMFEDILMEFAGADRVGNLFCLRARDAEGIADTLQTVLSKKNFDYFNTDEIRYSAMNMKAINTYGSLEFRGLPFNGDFDQIETWIQLLLAIKDFSLTLDTPKDLVSILSKKGGEKLAMEVFGELFHKLPKVDWNAKMLSSIRLVQRLVYQNDWDDTVELYFTIKTNLENNNEDQQPQAVAV